MREGHSATAFQKEKAEMEDYKENISRNDEIENSESTIKLKEAEEVRLAKNREADKAHQNIIDTVRQKYVEQAERWNRDVNFDNMENLDANRKVVDEVSLAEGKFRENTTAHFEASSKVQEAIVIENQALENNDLNDRLLNIKSKVTISEGQEGIEELERNNYNAVYVKALQNKERVVKVVTDENAAYDQRLAVKKEEVNRINDGVKDIVIRADEKKMGDEDERKAAKELITNAESKVVQHASEEAKKSDTKSETVRQGVDEINKLTESNFIDQRQKHQDTKSLVNEIENSEAPKYDKGKNALSKKYPEGVSQETFQELGSDGLVSAIITRRIVVINGYGDVYVRKQTAYATTYTKNDAPCSEYMWQKETNAAKLERHY